MRRPPVSSSRQRSVGFTLVELLVVIAVIAIIVGTLFVAFRAARSGSQRAGSVSSLRALAQAHSTYAAEHRGRLVPGYVNATLQQSLGIDVDLSDGFSVPPAAAATWVWRLSPYLDHSWRTCFAETDAGTLSRYTSLYEARDLVEISERPSFGLNGIFVGGDSDNGGGAIAALSPFNAAGNPTIAATRMSEIRSPATLVLFAPTLHVSGAGAPSDFSWYELRAPFLTDRQWETLTDAKGAASVIGSSGLDGTIAGVPGLRRGERTVPIGFADGSASMAEIDTLANDMRSWAPQATSPTWVVP